MSRCRSKGACVVRECKGVDRNRGIYVHVRVRVRRCG